MWRTGTVVAVSIRISNNVRKLLVRYGGVWARTQLLSYCWIVQTVLVPLNTHSVEQMLMLRPVAVAVTIVAVMFVASMLIRSSPEIFSFLLSLVRIITLEIQTMRTLFKQFNGGDDDSTWGMQKEIGRETNINANKYMEVKAHACSNGACVGCSGWASDKIKKRMKLFEFSAMVCHNDGSVWNSSFATAHRAMNLFIFQLLRIASSFCNIDCHLLFVVFTFVVINFSIWRKPTHTQ